MEISETPLFDSVTELVSCAERIEKAKAKLVHHQRVPFANAPGGACTCGNFTVRLDGARGEDIWTSHLAVAVAGCA